MDTPGNRLRRQQEQIIVNAARRALDNGHPAEDVLSLIERVTSFWQQNLISLLSIIVYQSRDEQVRRRALVLFQKHLGLCTDAVQLAQIAFWIRNPKRVWQVPMELQESVDGRRKALEPGWDGVWYDPGLGSSNLFLEITSKRPEEVFNTEACLVAMSQVRNWNPWIARYRALGGSIEDPKYLKIWVARTVARRKEPTSQVKEMLKKYCEVDEIVTVRAFLRHITPTREGLKGRDPNWAMAKYALLVYCGLERLEHDTDDWVHIAKSALYLRHRIIQRIAQRSLAGMERTPGAHRVFEDLNSINGEIRVTADVKRDIGPGGNPIWQSVYHQLPIDSNARRILIMYSRREAQAS